MGVYPEIYTVGDKSLNILVLKLYKRDYTSANLSNEAKICSLLSKKNSSCFLKYISNSIDELIVREKYIVLEYAEKGNLNNYVLLGNFFCEKLAKIFMWKIINAVKVMHDNGIVHGNLSLKNIFLDRFYNVKISGFEIAVIFGNENKNKKDCQKLLQEDIYKLGILLLQLITGRLDIKGLVKKTIQKGNFEMFWQIIKSQYNQSEIDLSPELQDLINIMLSKKTYDINTLFNHDWFSGFDKLSQCEIEELDAYMRQELKKLKGGEEGGGQD
jgi:serine/threonine protein kinase